MVKGRDMGSKQGQKIWGWVEMNQTGWGQGLGCSHHTKVDLGGGAGHMTLLGFLGSHDTANAGGEVTVEGEWQEAVRDQYEIRYSCSDQNLGPEDVFLHFL